MNIVLVLTQKFDPNAGGVQRTTYKLAKIYQSNHHKVIIVSYGNHITSEENYDGIKLFYVNQKEHFLLKEIFFNHKIDCILNQLGYSVSLTNILLQYKDSNTKLVNTLRINPLNFYDNHKNIIHEFFDRKKIGFLNNYITRKLILGYHVAKQNIELSFIVKNTDAFVMLSEKFKPELFFLVPSLKQYQHKIHGTGNPFQRAEINVKALPKENVILFVGRIDITQKRVDLLLQIWKQLHASHPNWKFWVCGEGEDKQYMEKFCLEHRLDRVTFFGKVNPDEYYKKAKIFHMTSAFEGFGNVLVEAQSFGCVPMLFDSYAAASEIIVHNKNGILIKPFDTEEYVKRTSELIIDDGKIIEMANNAYENVLRFSYEETYKKWGAVFESIGINLTK